MNPPVINSTKSVSKRKREAERSVNWTVEETQVLLCAWSDERIQKSLAENLRNRHVFKHLSARMSEMGFSRSPHQCRLRVKTLKANYVRAKLQRSINSSQPCTFKYFAEMDAVLGRRSGGREGIPCFVFPEVITKYHFDSTERKQSLLPDFDLNAEVIGHRFAPLGQAGRQSLSSSEEGGGRHSWQQDSEVKLEDGVHSADEFEYSNKGVPHQWTDKCQEVEQELSIHREISDTLEDSLSTPSPQGAPPAAPSPAPIAKSIASPLPALPDPGTTTLSTSGHCHNDSSFLEPVLKHLSECFQSLVSDTRGLLIQLENQRQEQARWHQELLAQWLQQEECRQREMAEREERREKARMEHEIRVLELLASLTKEQKCKCGDRQTVAEAQTGSNHTKK